MFNKEEFLISLDNFGMHGMQRKLWIKQFQRDPKKACQSYFTKLDNLYSGEEFWEIAKKVIIDSRKLEDTEEPTVPVIAEKPLVPVIKDWDYFYRINNYRWGCACYDWEEYCSENAML